MEDRIENLINSYIYNIANLNTKELFISNLPNLFFDSSKKIINAIIEYLLFELKTAEEMIEQNISVEEKQMLEEEIILIKNKIDWCKEILLENKKEEIEEEQLHESQNINLVFAKKNETTYFEDDLYKDVPREYYKDVLDCLDRIKRFGFTENKERQKTIGSIN